MAGQGWEPFEEVEHTADLALLARGRDLAELVGNACRGVIHLIADAEGQAPDDWAPVSVSGADPERLLVRFVKALLCEWDLRGGIPVAVEVGELRGDTLAGRIAFAHPGDDRLADLVKSLPKAVTYHDLAIRTVGDHLEALLVLDI